VATSTIDFTALAQEVEETLPLCDHIPMIGPRKWVLKCAMIAKESKLKLCLEKTENILSLCITKSLSDSSVHCVFRTVVLRALTGGHIKVPNDFVLLWQLYDISSSSEAKRVKYGSKSL
jgi:hypothetical protein